LQTAFCYIHGALSLVKLLNRTKYATDITEIIIGEKMKKSIFIILSVLVLAGCASLKSAEKSAFKSQSAFEEYANVFYDAVSLSEFNDGFNHARMGMKDGIPPYELYDNRQIAGIAENILFFQNPDGGWQKNVDYQRKYTLAELMEIKEKNKEILPVTYNLKKQQRGSTMDNRNIYSQIHYLALVYKQIPQIRYQKAALRGVQWILNAQEPKTGGFTGADVYGITFNDDIIANTLTFLFQIATDDETYDFIGDEIQKKALAAYNKGIECILKSQITVTLHDGSKLLTAWCQQHSYDNYAPIWARAFESPSICSAESKKVVEFLMKIENPSQEIKNSIIAACEFFDRDDIRIHGRKLEKVPLTKPVPGDPYLKTERLLVDDEKAPDLWARYYALDSGFDISLGCPLKIQGTYPDVLKPVWCDRGCKFVADHNDISMERRNGYAYTNTSMEILVSKEYPDWLKKNGISR